MRRLFVLLALIGCPKKPVTSVDPQLPEEASDIEREAPRALLERYAASDEVSLRGHALGFLIAVDPSLGPRGLHDPDGWVQRQAATALLAHGPSEPLRDFVARPTADPYVRGEVALALPEAPVVAAFEAESDPWRTPPLAYAALARGHQPALEPLTRSIARGELELDEAFVRSLGRCRSLSDVPPGACDSLLQALQEGEEWVEEELHLAYGVARMLLGDGSGEQLLRKALGEDLQRQVATLDLLVHVHTDEADALLRKARGGGEDLTRLYAEMILASRDEGAIDPFEQASSSRTTELRVLSARLAGDRLAGGEKKQARALEKLLETLAKDPSAAVREAAVQAAVDADLTLPGVYEAALVDESPRVRILGAGGLLQ